VGGEGWRKESASSFHIPALKREQTILLEELDAIGGNVANRECVVVVRVQSIEQRKLSHLRDVARSEMPLGRNAIIFLRRDE